MEWIHPLFHAIHGVRPENQVFHSPIMKERTMDMTILGIDLGKNVFQLHGIN